MLGIRGFGAVAATLLLLAASAAGQLHKDTRVGFQFKPPKEYRAVAISPTDHMTVAKYQSDQTDYGGEQGMTAYNAMFQILYFPVRESEEEDDEAETEDPVEKGLGVFETRYGYAEPEKSKTIKIAGTKAYEMHIAREDSALWMYWAVVSQEDGFFIFAGTAVDKRFKKHVSDFSKAAKSFKRIDKEEAAPVDEQLDDQERFLQAQIDKLPPGWDSFRSDRYLFLFNAEKSFVKEIADQIEALRDEYEKFYPPDEPIDDISIVRVCNSREEYMGYGGSAGSGGYWNSRARELVFFDLRPRDVTLAIANHEAFHQYIFYFYGELAPHSWYNEGHGDYFAGAKLTRTYRITEYGDAPGGIGRLGTIKSGARMLGEGKGPGDGASAPLKDLLRFSQREYYGDAGYRNCYAAGWSVVHMLRESKKLDRKWKKILPDYLDNLLAARMQIATEHMEKMISNAEKIEEGSSEDMSTDPEDYFAELDRDKIQDLAYTMTFDSWTDDDWEEFQEFWLEYVEKL